MPTANGGVDLQGVAVGVKGYQSGYQSGVILCGHVALQAQPRSLAETPEGAALGFGDALAASSSSSEGEEVDPPSSEEDDSDRDAAVAARARQVQTHTEAQQTHVQHVTLRK
jgi:hypothetical protein